MMKHRKLFPTSTAANQTDCTYFCDPSCPYECYPYPEYFMPPPPPPPTGQSQHIPPYVIIVVSLLASLFLLVSYYVVIVKYCSPWNRFRAQQTNSDGPDEEFVDENQGPPLDHPIWYIATVGLQPSTINSITVFRYKKSDRLIEGTECSVCLSEFQEDETLRLLPKCNHAFHIPCIDTWLRSHTNCPLCRASIVFNTLTTLASTGQNFHNPSPNEETQMENSDSDGELVSNSVSDGEVCENRARTEVVVELPHVDDERKEFENSKDLADNNMIMEDEIQPERNSVSIDSSTAANFGLAMANICVVESEGSSVNQKENVQEPDLGIVQNGDSSTARLMGGSVAQSLHKRPVSMKRSSSCGRSYLNGTEYLTWLKIPGWRLHLMALYSLVHNENLEEKWKVFRCVHFYEDEVLGMRQEMRNFL
ncbi:hypothetical protein F0562_027736 [Nyssa sinensis]|uniref:RING-type E3 ubiquitin transferase n=1 Tax=Nyssa sinensis TaxID=561372 RepID=A0A5J5B689_9ASTE|nr:hypothetical protein F0562_027736 [Nyssa sinensis]